MLSQTSRPTVLALLLVLVGAPLSGCFSDPAPGSGDGAPADHISRTWTLALDAQAMREIDSASDPFAELESRIEASLVVRTGESGDFVLVYTAPDGEEVAVPLSDMAPGVARTVPGVDPFAGATLKRGDTVLATRAPLADTWTRVGEMPLGLRLAPGSELAYTQALDITSTLRAEDVKTQGDIAFNALAVDVHLPLRGTLSLASAADGASETRFDIVSRANVAKPSAVGSLVLIEADALSNGEPLVAGIDVPNVDAFIEMGMSAWMEGDRLTALRSGAGATRFNPEVYAWAQGADAERYAGSCAGTARADRCMPDEVPENDHAWEAGERDELEENLLVATTPGERHALRFMERLFAHDMAVGDTFTLVIEYDSEDDEPRVQRDVPSIAPQEHHTGSDTPKPVDESNTTTTGTTTPTQPTTATPYPAYATPTPPMYEPPAPNPSRIRYAFTFETTVVEKTSLDVAAGTFDALQVAQTARVTVDAPQLHESRWDYQNHTQHWDEVARDLHVDETVARHTIWLDAQRFVPLRVESELPVEPDAILGRITDALTADGWAEAGFQEFPRDALTWTLNARGTLEATRVGDDMRVSPAMGLTLATLLGGGAGLGNQGVGSLMFGMPWRHQYAEHATPVAPPSHPMPTPTPPYHGDPSRGPMMELAMHEQSSDGVARFQVRYVTNMTWDEIVVRLDGDAMPTTAAACDDRPTHRGYFMCRNGELLSPSELVWAGDMLTVTGFHEGVSLELVHEPTGTVLYGMGYATPTH